MCMQFICKKYTFIFMIRWFYTECTNKFDTYINTYICIILFIIEKTKEMRKLTKSKGKYEIGIRQQN